MFHCKHNWIVITDKVLPSAFEQLKNYKVDTVNNMSIFIKTSITILQCSKCGKLDKTIVKSGDSY